MPTVQSPAELRSEFMANATETGTPDSPQTRIALASAYAKAGRAQEAARERAEFVRLDRLKLRPEKP